MLYTYITRGLDWITNNKYSAMRKYVRNVVTKSKKVLQELDTDLQQILYYTPGIIGVVDYGRERIPRLRKSFSGVFRKDTLEERIEKTYVKETTPPPEETIKRTYDTPKDPVVATDYMQQEIYYSYMYRKESLQELAQELSAKYHLPISSATISSDARKYFSQYGILNRRDARRIVKMVFA